MAILTTDTLYTLNKQMLGLGAPVELDGIGYNKIDYDNMYDFAIQDIDTLTPRQVWFIAKTLGRYKNTQLTAYKADIEETITYYNGLTDKTMVRVVGKDKNTVHISWRYNAVINDVLKRQLDKTQYYWSKATGNWELCVKWAYVPTLVNAFESNDLNCAQVIAAYESHNSNSIDLFEQPETITIAVKRTEDIDTLAISFPYNKEVIDVLHTIPNALWDKKNVAWNIYIETAAQLYDSLPNWVDKTQLKPWADLVHSWDTVYDLVNPSQYNLPFTPYAFQPTDATKLLTLKAGLNANEVGCGKTFEMVLIGESLPMRKLVICPATLRLNWEKEIKMVNPNADVHIQYSDQPFELGANWNIIGYPSLTKFQTQLESANFQVIMADEAHYIQAVNNYGKPDSQRAKSILRLAATAGWVFPITGTPKTSRNKNLFNILRMIRHPLTRGFGAFQQYGKYFCNGTLNGYGWDYNGNSNDDELHDLLQPYMVRHLKRDVLPHLKKQRQAIPVSINLREYNRMIQEFLQHKAAGDGKELVYITKAKQSIAIQKAKHSIEFAKGFVESGEQVVIVTGYTDVIKKIESAFNCVKLVGGMSDKAKQAAIDAFQSGKVPVIAINIAAGGVGVTLTAAHTMIINDFPWTPGELEQAEGRIWRGGQTHTAMVYFLNATGCDMDAFLTDIIVNKSQSINAAIDGGTGEDIDFQSLFIKHLELRIKI